MNRHDGFIDQLESYLDEYDGVTPLPQTVRDAVRAELPKTKQTGSAWGPVRYLTMTFPKAAQVGFAAAAAILVVAIGAFVLGRPNIGGPDDQAPSPSATASATATASPTAAAASCSTSTADATGGDRLEVAWCPIRTSEESTPIPFTMEGPSSWIDQIYGDRGVMFLRPEGGGAIVFALREGESVDDLVADVRARAGYVISNEGVVSLDGADGVVFDVTLEEGTADPEPLLAGTTAGPPWNLQAGTFSRVWIVDKEGDTVMIITGADLADAVGEALATLTWD
jgi:hypothetical protein